MIELIEICKSFDGKKILDRLTLSVKKGERIAIIGESGCGKSSLLKIISNLLPIDHGHIHYSDSPPKIGFLFQQSALFDSLNVFENVAFSLVESRINYASSYIKEEAMKALKWVDLEHIQESMPSELSGGQRKRVSLARALVTKPTLMLYDEPTTGLDPILSTHIENLIVKLNTEFSMTTIVVTHQISTILRTVDKIYFLNDGKLLAPESPQEIMRSSNPIIRRFMEGKI